MSDQAINQDKNIKQALQKASGLLSQDPEMAAENAQNLIDTFPDLEAAHHILGAALRYQGKPTEALKILKPLNQKVPNSPLILHELGLCYGAAGEGKKAIKALRRVVELDPKNPNAWISLGDQLSVLGDEKASREAYDKHLAASTKHPEIVEAAELLKKGEIPKAEQKARQVVMAHPTDVSAIRMLAEIGIKVGRLEDAQKLLERCLELAPDYHLARNNYTIVLFRMQNLVGAMEQIEILLKVEPNNPNYLVLKGSIMVRKGDHEEALELYEGLLKNYPDQARPQLNYGHTLKTVGRLDDSIRAYHKAIELSPNIGEAYWSLANLKTFGFTEDDIKSMKDQVTVADGDGDDQAHLAFALGKALEDKKEFDESFKFYKRGNAIRSINHRYNPQKNVYDSARQINTLTKEFFASREGYGCQAPDPIFIVGLPRAGSTLIEQILASHSKVEGTAELTDIIATSRRLGGKDRYKGASKYPEILNGLTKGQFKQLGEDYIKSTQIQRNDTPYFIDKMPNNFLHIGLIHTILPNAKIIDARRHPMGGCFSGFKQLFASGQTFTYNLESIGYYYRDYVRVMDHWDDVLPGRVHLVQYEDMVGDTENQIRKMLDYCGLEFEQGCLEFYKTDRAIRTPSSEQVRQPVYKGALDQWRNFDTHLGPLKKALGPILERYPID